MFQVELNDIIGYGYSRPAGANYVLTGQGLSGTPILVSGLTKVEVRYAYDATLGKYVINTMFPIPSVP